jgi:hypothetical protein
MSAEGHFAEGNAGEKRLLEVLQPELHFGGI